MCKVLTVGENMVAELRTKRDHQLVNHQLAKKRQWATTLIVPEPIQGHGRVTRTTETYDDKHSPRDDNDGRADAQRPLPHDQPTPLRRTDNRRRPETKQMRRGGANTKNLTAPYTHKATSLNDPVYVRAWSIFQQTDRIPTHLETVNKEFDPQE